MIEVPGEIPMSPDITELPVLVIVLPASTANDCALPRLTAEGAAKADCVPKLVTVANATLSTASEPTPTFKLAKLRGRQ